MRLSANLCFIPTPQDWKFVTDDINRYMQNIRQVNPYTANILQFQATLAPPVGKKMFKGLLICYAVVVTTFFSVAISGYWAFGNQAAGYILTNLAPRETPSLVPNWLIYLANIFVLAQLFAVALVSISCYHDKVNVY